MLYYAVSDPIVKGQKLTEEELKAMLQKEFTMRGLVNYENDICTMLDSDLRQVSVSSDVIAVSTDKNGDFKSGSEICSTKEFEKMSSFVNRKMQEIGGKIRQGDMEKKPYKKGETTGCTYCPYQGICGFDLKIPGYGFNAISLSSDEAMENIMSEG